MAPLSEAAGRAGAGRGQAPAAPVFPFFVGCGRSGTTLLRSMFDAHPDVAIVYESHFVAKLGDDPDRYREGGTFRAERLLADLRRFPGSFPHFGVAEDDLVRAWSDPEPRDYPDAIRRLYHLHAAQQGKTRYGDKSPAYVMRMPELARLFPESRFVHLIRDGRDVVTAYLANAWGPASLEQASLYWTQRVRRGRRQGRLLGPARYREVHFEALVDHPEATLRSLCDFVEIDFDPAMLRYYERRETAAVGGHPGQHRGLSRPPTKGMRDWRKELDAGQVGRVEVITGRLLDELGYPRAEPPPTLAHHLAAGRGVAADAARRGLAKAGPARRRAQPRPGTEPAPGSDPAGRLADFVIIGMMKSGTSTLHQWLGGHPGCGLSLEKEPDYFSSEQAWGRGPAWYGGLFAHVPEGRLAGEASTSYTKPWCNPGVAAKRMADVIPEARLLYLLRHPLERMRSHYLHEVRRSRESRPFTEALTAGANPYVALSRYHACLLAYLEHFPREQICVVTSEGLWEAPHPSWHAVLDHLGLERRPPPEDHHNATADKAHFTPAMLRLWSSGRYEQARRLAGWIPGPARRAARDLLIRRRSATATLERSVTHEVPEAVADQVWADVARLEGWLGRRGHLWAGSPAAPSRE